MFGELNVNRILVAIDGSENSIKAANYSLLLADKFKARVIALYVVPQNVGNDSESHLKATETVQDFFDNFKHSAIQAHVGLNTDIGGCLQC